MKTNSALPACLRTVVLLAFLLNAALGWAADGNPPERMTYQGYLTDPNGDPLGNTNTGPKNYDVIFRVYTDATGGTKLWAEQQTVTVDRGYFSVLLGEGSIVQSEPRPALSMLFTNVANASDRYIEVTVQGIGPSGGPVQLAPRLRLLTSPYAFLARNAVSANSLANNASAQIVSVVGANVGINKASPVSALDISGTVTATGLDVTGPVRITGKNVLEFGIGEAGKGASAGKIGYKWYDNGLNISGAGADGARVVSILAENGTYTLGGVGVNKGTITAGYKLDVNGAARVGGDVAATGSVTATSFSGNGTVPIGGIIMWSGTTVPSGWALCNGATVNGQATPDLRNRFVVGAGTGSDYTIGATGGTNSVTLNVDQIPPHSHTYTTRYQYENGGGTKDNHWNSSATANTGPTGGGQAHENRPPYYALAYIMRVQ